MDFVLDNWSAGELKYDDYIKMQCAFPVLQDGDDNQRQYYLMKEKTTGLCVLINQLWVGLDCIHYVTIVQKHYSLIMLTCMCYIVDCKSAHVYSYKELYTPCVDIVTSEGYVFIICEIEILKYDPQIDKWTHTYELPDAVENIRYSEGSCQIILANGESLKIDGGLIYNV